METPKCSGQSTILGKRVVIFLTLGTQLAFDRLVLAVDTVAETVDEEIFGQIGNATYVPKHFKAVQFMDQKEFDECFEKARIIIGHAGMGTILTAMRQEKPLIVMARQAALGEHRNDHQCATVEQLGRLPGIYVVETAEDIKEILSRAQLASMTQAASPARENLIRALRQEIFGS